MVKNFDAIVVGAGQAGPSLAGRLTASGLTVAVVERHLFGGTCVNTGCMPTKTLVASAYAAHMAGRAADFGVVIRPIPGIDMRRVKARADKVASNARNGVEGYLRGMAGCTIYKGHACFEAPGEIRVDDTLLTAPRIFLNVGGRAVIPDFPGVDEVPYLTNASILRLEHVPEHLIVVGGGYIGLEFAQMYRRFGAGVTVVERGPRLASAEDENTSAAIQDIFEAEGIGVRTDAECISLANSGRGVAVNVNCKSGPPVVQGSHVLLAVGRRPNTDDLGLQAAGVRTDAGGFIEVNDELATNAPGVWALGDCNGKGAFTHTAFNDFEIVAANLFDGEARKVSDRIPAKALYIDPPLGRVGLTLREARQTGRPLLVGYRPMTAVGRAIEKDETKGFMQCVVDAETKQILGAAILGTGGDEAIHGVVDVMNLRAPFMALVRAVPIHPTVSELLPTLFGSLAPDMPG